MLKAPSLKTYRTDASGQFLISAAALRTIGASHADRIVDTELWGRPARVLILDQPFQLGERMQGSDGHEYRLRRIRLHELPGWPPRMASSAHVKALPPLMECRLREATYSSGGGPGQEAVEIVVEHDRKAYRAWLVGCPVPLLHSAAATLNQDGAEGKKIEDLQDWRLVGPS